MNHLLTKPAKCMITWLHQFTLFIKIAKFWIYKIAKFSTHKHLKVSHIKVEIIYIRKYNSHLKLTITNHLTDCWCYCNKDFFTCSFQQKVLPKITWIPYSKKTLSVKRYGECSLLKSLATKTLAIPIKAFTAKIF